jgi:hypothetical protein
MLFVRDHLKKETVDRALERFVEQAGKTSYFQLFWEMASGYLIADWVESGKISPWILLGSKRAQRALSNMPDECFARIANSVDAGYWGKKIEQNPHDVDWVREIIDGESKDEII